MVPAAPGPPHMYHSDPTTAKKHTQRAQQLRRSHGAGLGTPSKLHVGSRLTTTHGTSSHHVSLAAPSSFHCWVQSINTAARQPAASPQSPFIPLSSGFCQREASDEEVNGRRKDFFTQEVQRDEGVWASRSSAELGTPTSLQKSCSPPRKDIRALRPYTKPLFQGFLFEAESSVQLQLFISFR